MTTVCITGAAGNLGSLTARHLLDRTDLRLHLMTHKRPLSFPFDPSRATAYSCDLAEPETLRECLRGVDHVVHYAGVLFQARPEKFLPTTNTAWFRNLLDAAREAGVRKVTLVSFPHVEGPSSREHPSTDRLDGCPVSWHARTRLEEERLLREAFEDHVVLRVGMVYGRGILMPDAARWFARRRLLGVWRDPTPIHLVSRTDFLETMRVVTENDLHGTFNIGDEGNQTLQEFLDVCCEAWKCAKPWRMPLGLIRTAAALFEGVSALTGWKSPLTRDFIEIGRVPYHGDTSRFRAEIRPTLAHPTLREGREIL